MLVNNTSVFALRREPSMKLKNNTIRYLFKNSKNCYSFNHYVYMQINNERQKNFVQSSWNMFFFNLATGILRMGE